MTLYNIPAGRQILSSALKRSMGERLSPYLGEQLESSRLGSTLKNFIGM